MNKLKLHPNDDSPVIVIESSLVRVGRDDGSDVCIPDGSVSRHHAEIEFRGGEWFIFDLNSSNGIRINGLPVPNARLQSGQVLQIGRVDFHVEVDTPGDNATMVLDRSPVFEEGPGATMISPGPPRAMPRGVQREAPRSKASDAMTTLTAIAVSVAVVLGAIEIYSTFGKPSEPAAVAPVEPVAAPAEAGPPAAAPGAVAPRTGAPVDESALAPGKGALLVSTDLPATVSVDGQKGVRLEASGLKRFEVAPGDHVVRFRADGWRANVEARVRAGEQTLVKPDDDPSLAKATGTPR